ncbi:MAG TPA: CsbD family protein [Candidatus Kapabacteria bacterium]|nr:CsbD family protein [Candidatus Kapabacteria bacterium]
MNEDIIKGKWKQLKGDAQRKWGKLTNDDLDVLEGNREYLIGRIQERTGRARDIVEREVKEFERKLSA